MTERLLQFIWQFQYFNKAELRTEQGEHLQIIAPGNYNRNQGPDFSHASIKIDETKWVGNIELHLKSSDWYKHKHSTDRNFSNIILHVVWEHDEEIRDIHDCLLPTLTLQQRVPKVLLERYQAIMESKEFVPVEKYLPAISDLAWSAWKERLAVERLQRKSETIQALLKEANNHWEEIFWWILARNFGMKVNAEVFETVAKSLPINILGRHKNQIHQIEALLFGQANLLTESSDDNYATLLQREFQFLQKKYSLQQLTVKPFFLRMRPANFPTVRLAQLAMLVHQSTHLFSKIKETHDLAGIKELLNVKANDYWHYHYNFKEQTAYKPKVLGEQMVNNIIINTVTPILFAYGSRVKEEEYKEKAIRLLAELEPEKNSITNKWQLLGVNNRSALDSQALIELKNNYCNEKRCLECAVGNAIMKNS